ncbi:MAG: MASE1 domain-containing protein [Hyphomicrobiaceae bacterium]|nr:MASE1 domain-containing protein [Hyphomicrobiaceae bacterium]
MSALAAALYLCVAYGALAIQSRPEGVAIFWPASGVAVGLLLARGRAWTVPVAIGTIAGTICANLLHGRSPLLAVAFSAANAVEALLVFWIMERQSGAGTSLQRLANALYFFGASAVACAVAAAVAAGAIRVAGASEAPVLDIWLVWLLSDYVGIVVLAPLLVAAVALAGQPARHHEWTADIALLFLLAVVAWNALKLPSGAGSWQSLAPGTTVLPVVVWLAARGQPLAPAMGLVMLAALMAMAAALGLGRFGDASIPVGNRILAAQASLTVISLVTLSISALFHERRDAEARLRESTERLAAIAEASPGTMLSILRQTDGRLRFVFLASTADSVLGLGKAELEKEAGPFLARLAPADRDAVLGVLGQPPQQVSTFRLEAEYEHPTAGVRWIELSAAPVANDRGELVWHGYAQDVTGRRIMTDELNHRTRNLLSVVQAVTELTARSTEPSRFAEVLGERMEGLLRCHDLLDSREWHGVDIEALVKSQLSHVADLVGRRILLEGPRVLIKPGAAQIIGMALHELATNAMKYGALSNDAGSIRISWATAIASAGGRLQLTWRELDGPEVTPVTRSGFGQKVIVDMVQYQLEAVVALRYEADGVVWQLDAPAGRTLDVGIA